VSVVAVATPTRLGAAPAAVPLCSIVVNNFNYARFLPQCIESALAQTHPRTEVVVVDDASTDGSADVIRAYAGRVVPVLLSANGGQAAAMNAGFRACRGDIVLFLDADDYLYPGAAARVVTALGPGMSKVQFRLHLVDAEGRTIDLFPAPEVRFDSGDVLPELLARGRYETTVTSGNAFPRRVLERILPVPEGDFRISADGYLVTVAPFLGPVASIEEPQGGYRQHDANLWSSGQWSTLGERLRRSLRHDAHKYRALAERARASGLDVAPCPGLRDDQHLGTRLASLVVAPSLHPHADDWRISLALRGAWRSREARLPWKRRAILAAWFLAAGLLPRPLARPAVAWRLAPRTRGKAVDRVIKAVRRLAR
jgi:glycosyltransferase involved in cell wall biosynthesis